jgi:hypothetical protein
MCVVLCVRVLLCVRSNDPSCVCCVVCVTVRVPRWRALFARVCCDAQEAAAGNGVHLRADLQTAQGDVARLSVRVQELEAQRRVNEKQLKVCRCGGVIGAF